MVAGLTLLNPLTQPKMSYRGASLKLNCIWQ